MFSGPTADQWVDILSKSGDARRPRGTTVCEACEVAKVPARDLRPVYGVSCVVRLWQAICDDCVQAGRDGDDTFECDDCGHTHETNTSWELHYTDTPDGDRICLKCAAGRALSSKDFWVTDPAQVTSAWIQSRPHITANLCAGQVAETGWGETIGALSGGLIYDDGPGAATRALRTLREDVALALEGHAKAALIISRAYQFAVYLEVVVPA